MVKDVFSTFHLMHEHRLPCIGSFDIHELGEAEHKSFWKQSLKDSDYCYNQYLAGRYSLKMLCRKELGSWEV